MIQVSPRARIAGTDFIPENFRNLAGDEKRDFLAF